MKTLFAMAILLASTGIVMAQDDGRYIDTDRLQQEQQQQQRLDQLEADQWHQQNGPGVPGPANNNGVVPGPSTYTPLR